uniref:beta-N-acetylhexosaminidase n=1 Tax=Macrostomum lignano TaxID=282301 RepID=A0A1I8J7F9_9PLAT
ISPLNSHPPIQEAMAMNKMNVFHWHMVDDQSFPYLSKKFPQFVQKSAFPGGRYYYTAEDIAEIVEFARQRGIRVVPEFDTPDHTHSWGHAARTWCPGAPRPAWPTQDPSTHPAGHLPVPGRAVLRAGRALPGQFCAPGHDDEVSLDCWRLNASVSKFMRENKMTAHEQLVVYFANRLSGIVENLPVRRSVVVWEDILDKDSSLYPLNLPKDAIVQVWITRDSAKLDRWRQRYRLIRSEDWYLDHRGYGADWVKRYRFHPGPDDLGGEACLWTEFQSDNTVMPRAWPSTSAVAERLWSGEAATEPVEAAPRIEEQNCRMM